MPSIKQEMTSNRVPKVLPKHVPSAVCFRIPTTSYHMYTEEIMEKEIIFQVVKLHLNFTNEDSLLIYVNDKEQDYHDDICLAMMNEIKKDSPLSTVIFGGNPDIFTREMCSRLAEKLGKPVYLSCNLDPICDFLPIVEEKLLEKMVEMPDIF
ncbi:unnamed protein product [Acanthoscelides obtectus]|uniref:Proteasome assembly chaperone 4 n=1 Tax=Acanthoscelides obtectus TaxID=200917 RepID=A0A9P0PC90_ACAOB|nr:unnamed protein product [Acanthoscelides obtectus]CAK1671644.1 hypothetical protein AOBTE_LOCUS28383 [Acanthoscelides obtectus]